MENNLQTTLAGIFGKFIKSIVDNDFSTYKSLLDPQGLAVKSSPPQSTDSAPSLEEGFKFLHQDFVEAPSEPCDEESPANPDYKNDDIRSILARDAASEVSISGLSLYVSERDYKCMSTERNVVLYLALLRQVNGEWKIWMPGFGSYEKTSDTAENARKVEEEIKRFIGSVKFTMELLPTENTGAQNSQNVQLSVTKITGNMDVKVFINGIDLEAATGKFSSMIFVNKEYDETPFPAEQKILNVGKNTIKIEYQPTGNYASLKFDLTARGYIQPILKLDIGNAETKDIKSGTVEREFDLQTKEPAGFKTIVIRE